MDIDGGVAGIPFRRDRAWFEVLAILLSLSVALAVMLALVETLWFFFTDPFPEAWSNFAWCWQRAFVAVVALLGTLALFTRWLPRRGWLRWAGLALAIGAAGAMGWFAEDGL